MSEVVRDEDKNKDDLYDLNLSYSVKSAADQFSRLEKVDARALVKRIIDLNSEYGSGKAGQLDFAKTHSKDEYFIVENRWGGTSYDKELPDLSGGLGIWHIMEDPVVYGSVAPPP